MKIKTIYTANAICIISLIFIGYKLTAPVNTYWDIIAADEISYLKLGKNLFKEVQFDWGFMYNLWYKFLSLFQHSTVSLYYFNYRVLMIGIPVLLFICLVVYNVPTLIAFVIAYLFLISKLHLTTWPFVSDFCSVLILSYFILIKWIKDIGIKSLVLSFFCLLLYLTRPEYMLAFIPAVAYAFYVNKSNKTRWLALLLFIAIVGYVGSQTTKIEGVDRAFFAYAQHYAITYKIWHKNSPLDIYGYIKMAPKIFGKSYTLLGSICYNPIEAVRHIATVTGFYLLTLIKSVEDLLLPAYWFKSIGKLKHVLFVLVVFFFFMFYRKNKSAIIFRPFTFVNFSILLFFVAAAIPNFLIGYTPHYLQLHFILYVFLFSVLWFNNYALFIKTRWFLGLAILLYILTPNLKNYNFQQVDAYEYKNVPIQKMAAFVNKTNNGKAHCLLAYQTNIHFVFDGNNFTGIDVFSINKPFLQFIVERKVDFIYVNRQLLTDEKLNKDNEWKMFFNNPEKYHFIKQVLPKTENYLLIKRVGN